MKKLSFLLFLALGVTACSVESMDSTENLLTADAQITVSAFSLTAPSEICAGLPATFSYGAPVKSNLQVQQLVGGEWVQVYHNNKSGSLIENVVLTFPTAGEYTLRYKDEQGFSAPMTVTVVNCNTCQESFSWTNDGEGLYTFTYVPSQGMSNAELTLTFPQAFVTAPTGWIQMGNDNASAWKKTVNLIGCTTYSWTFTLQSDCKGEGQKEANLWTDFKVGEVSKKGTAANITESCTI